MRKISTLHLLIAFGVLLALYFGIQLLGDDSRSKSFREELVEIDTTNVTQIIIAKALKTTQLEQKEDGNWQVLLDNGNWAAVEKNKITGALSMLLTIKPSRLATRKVEKWKEFQVDSAGTNVQVYEGTELSLDLIIGRFGAKGQREFYTYVRLADEDEVYTADNFMSFSLSTDVNSYRNQQLARINSIDSINQVAFSTSNEGFILAKFGTGWSIDGIAADSAAVANYFQGLRFLSSSAFVDDFEPSKGSDMAITLDVNGQESIGLEAYAHPAHKWAITSLTNDAFFADSVAFNKIFKQKADFLGVGNQE